MVIVGGGDSRLRLGASTCSTPPSAVTLVHRREGFRAHEATVGEVMDAARRAARVDLHVPYQIKRRRRQRHRRGRRSSSTPRTRTSEVDVAVRRDPAPARVQDRARAAEGLGLRDREGRDRASTGVMKTSLDRVWACGDITTFDGKLKLIATGFAEAAIAVAQAVHHIRPEMKIQPKYSTNTGVPGRRRGPGLDRAGTHLRAADPVLARLLDERRGAADAAAARAATPYARARARDRRPAALGAARRARSTGACSSASTAARRRREEVLADDPDELRVAVGLSRAKVGLPALAGRARARRRARARPPRASSPTTRSSAELVAVKGIGEWSAHIFLMFTLGRPDVLAVGDLGIRRAVERAYGLDGPARGRGADRARRAVAPAPHGGLPAPVALAGQRPDVSTRRSARRAATSSRRWWRSSATPGRSSRRSGCPRSRYDDPGYGRRARAVPGRRARMGGGRRRRPSRRLPGQRRRRRLRARRAGQRRSRPRPARARSGARRPPRGGGRRRGPPRADADDLPRRAVERALLRAPGLPP